MLLKKIGFAIIVIALIIGVFYIYNQDKKALPLSKLPQYEVSALRPAVLPKLAPTDFPVYPDAEVLRMESKPPADFAVGFASKDSPQNVFNFLLENAKIKGWQIIQQQRLIFRSTKDNTTVTISVSQNSGEKTAILEQVSFTR